MKSSLQDIFTEFSSQMVWRTPEASFTYHDLEMRVRRHAALLQNQGARPEDFWAVKNWPALDTFALLLAAMWQRITLFPLPDRLPEAHHQLMMKQIPLTGCLDLANLDEEEPAHGRIDCDVQAPAVGIFTSGSTGLPKAIVHSWNSLASSALATNSFYGFKPGDTWLLSLDPAHIGGLQIAVRCFLGGGVTWHLTEPKAVAAALYQESPAFISLVPTQLYRLLHDTKVLDSLRKCRAVILGGAAASSELLDDAVKSAVPVSVSYGSSESAALCAALPPGTLPRHPGDVGQLLSGWEYQHKGETLRLRGPAAARGYYQQMKWTPLLDQEGWMTLPDRILCDQGRLTILGRADGIFQVAGENVSPMEIVQPLEALRHQADFLALPWQDKEYGTIPILIVRSLEKPALEAILDRLQKHLSGVQRPRHIYWHVSDEITKPSRSYYEKALERQELPLLWRQDLGRI
jgi:O-succinylbenzoic acid--CoA ligase